MKRQNMQDERVSAQRRGINSEAYGILMMALLVSILVQQFLLDAPLEQYAAELICFLGMSVYILVRYMMIGLNLFGEGKRAKNIPLVNSITTGIVVTAVNGVLNYSKYAEHYHDNMGLFIFVLLVTFISAAGVIFVLLLCVDFLNTKRQAKIQQRLDEDEQSE